jgi:hypothetical protein
MAIHVTTSMIFQAMTCNNLRLFERRYYMRRKYNTIVKIKRAKGKKKYLLNITQNTKDRKTLTSLTTGLNCGSTEGGTGPAPHVTTVV